MKYFAQVLILLVYISTPVLFYVSTTSAANSSESSAQQSKKELSIMVIIGDSLTEGYGVSKESAFPAVLEKKINQNNKAKWTVINAGVSGSTTSSVMPRLKWQMKSPPDLVLIALGANDGLRGIDVKVSEKNLIDAIEFLKSKNIKVLLGGIYVPPNYGKEYSDEFKKMYLRISKSHNVPLIPFILDKVGGKPEYNLSDGIHPNEKGHEIIAENIYSFVMPILQK